MSYEELQLIVERAAELLPEPPPPGDAAGQARWQALALGTGRRLAQLARADADLLRVLLSDEFDTPASRLPRRRLLLRVALLAASVPARSEAVRLAVPSER